MSSPRKITNRKFERMVEAAWERYFSSVPGTPESIEYLRMAVSMPLVPEYRDDAKKAGVREFGRP